MGRSDINIVACELIDIKNEIKELLEKERLLKEEIEPLLLLETNNEVLVSGERISLKRSNGLRNLTKDEILEFLSKNYGDLLKEDLEDNYKKSVLPTNSIYVYTK